MERKTGELNPSCWVKEYGNTMYQYSMARVNDEEDASDLVQETLLAALKSAPAYKGEASEKNWLFSILKNKIVDYYRSKAKKRVVQELPELTGNEEEWFDESGSWRLQHLPQEWHFSQTTTERKELQRIIDQCKEDLKEVQRQVFVLKYMEDRDADFICKVLQISSSNYWVLLHRCRLQMRHCVEHYWLQN